jgi:hypothetical protein
MAELVFEERLMTRYTKRPPGVLLFLLGFVVMALHSEPAQAQYGMGGFGWGWGGLGFHQVPSATGFLNQYALTRAAAGMQMPRSFNPLSGNPNAYWNRARDNGFVSHYDVNARRSPAYRRPPTTSPSDASRAESQPAAANPVPPLVSFFNAAQKLVWPDESPTAGDLKEKRDRSDLASLAVLEETRRQNAASLSSVTYARQKLLDYGRPALKEIRTQTTPVISDAFHHFMLSLYDSLAQAASPPAANSGAAPNP